MKTRLFGAALVAFTLATIALYPTVRGAGSGEINLDPLPVRTADRIEVVFVLDTTSSMGGLIETAKEKIWSIATTMAQASQSPEIKMGLVAFRDKGDEYVTQVVDLSPDLDTMYTTLMQYAAVGGGDGPESVNAALDAAVNDISWSQDEHAYRTIFLVGDAPPHMDYRGERQYPQIVTAAARRGIVVNTIQCGEVAETVTHWSEIAQLGKGRYMRVGQAGDAFSVSTPYDREIAKLSEQLDDTRVFFGDAQAREAFEVKSKATSTLHHLASTAARARRAIFNSTAAGIENLFGDSDLVEEVVGGRVKLEDVPESALPESLQPMAPAEREAELDRIAEQRAALQARIDALGKARSEYIDERVEEAGGAVSSFDRQIYDAVRDQAADKGLTYDSGPAF